MENRIIKGINDHYYYERLDNGLQVYMFPNKNKKAFSLNFSTKFGGIHNSFKFEDESDFHKVPFGIAHFLEHQLFQLDNEKSVSEIFDKLGVNCNARTSHDCTSYTVNGNMNFKKSLITLLDYVQTPHFSYQGTNKEKGIIIEEINMIENQNGYVFYQESMLSMFEKSNYRYSVSGTKEDVSSITTEDLNLCYKYFYHPSNMFLIITGNFNPKATLELIVDNQKQKEFGNPKKIELEPIIEPTSFYENNKIFNFGVEYPIIGIYYKMPRKVFEDLGYSIYKFNFYMNYILKNNFGSTSDLNQTLFENKDIFGDLGYERSIYGDYIVFGVDFRSNNKDKVKDLILDKFKNIDVSLETFNRFKKVLISSIISSSEFAENYEGRLMNYILEGDDFPDDLYDVIRNYQYEDVFDVIKNLNLDNNFIIEMLPNNR